MKFNELDRQSPQAMQILNITPDSFSDGGRFYVEESAFLDRILKQVEASVNDGVRIFDIGGESTRPGAIAVSLADELDRVLPVVDAIARRFDVVISVDSSSPAVMKQALSLGAGLLNDVRSFRREGALDVAANSDAALCIMHMLSEPIDMQNNPKYSSVVDVVRDDLLASKQRLEAAGVDSDRILIDPGFGFGKTLNHNVSLMQSLGDLSNLAPLLIGVSNKRMIGDVTGREVSERATGSAIAAFYALNKGAWIIRAHDASATMDAIRMFQSLR